MKKIIKLSILTLLILISTGCVKANIELDIKKDKSMNFTIIEAYDKSLMESGNSEITEDKEKYEKYEDSGFYVQDYKDGNMVGYTISRQFENIDLISTEGEVIYELDIEKMSDSSKNMFSIKKGFFKNVYTAKMVFSGADDMTSDNQENSNDENSDIEEETTIDGENPFGEDFNYSSMLSALDVKFSVKLPYKAISSNATIVENDNKSLTWEVLKPTNNQTIDFEFALYNMTNIYLVGAGVLILIVLFVVAIINSNKSNNHQVKQNNSQNYFNNPQTNNSFINNNQSSVNEYNTNQNNSFIQSMDNSINEPPVMNMDSQINSDSINSFIQKEEPPINSFFSNIPEQNTNLNNNVDTTNNYFAGYTTTNNINNNNSNNN